MKNIKEVCKIVAWLAIIFGTLGSIYLAYEYGVSLQSSYYTYLERNWVFTILIFAFGVVSSLVFAIPLFALSEIIEKQDLLLSRFKGESTTPIESLNPLPTAKDASVTPAKEKDPTTFIVVFSIIFIGCALIALMQVVSSFIQ